MTEVMDRAVSRAGLLELKEEIDVFRQGHRFLDEKRMLVAQELLRRATAWRSVQDRVNEMHEEAVRLLRAALRCYGFDGLQVARPLSMRGFERQATEQSFLGVALLGPSGLELVADDSPDDDLAEARTAWLKLAQAATELGVAVANLLRLINDYRRTERRTLALEDILIPELETARSEMDGSLEELERDEIIRVRIAGRD